MAQAIRTLTVEKGIEPRDFALVAFGGAGPMHAVFLAQELDIREVDRPSLPRRVLGVGHAGDARSARTSPRPTTRSLADLDHDDLARTTRGAGAGGARGSRRGRHRRRPVADPARARHPLRRPGVHAHDRRSSARASRARTEFDQAISDRFDEAHEQRFGHANPGAPVEFVASARWRFGDLGRAAAAAVRGAGATELSVARGARDRVRGAPARGASSSAATICPSARVVEGRR